MTPWHGHDSGTEASLHVSRPVWSHSVEPRRRRVGPLTIQIGAAASLRPVHKRSKSEPRRRRDPSTDDPRRSRDVDATRPTTARGLGQKTLAGSCLTSHGRPAGPSALASSAVKPHAAVQLSCAVVPSSPMTVQRGAHCDALCAVWSSGLARVGGVATAAPRPVSEPEPRLRRDPFPSRGRDDAGAAPRTILGRLTFFVPVNGVAVGACEVAAAGAAAAVRRPQLVLVFYEAARQRLA